MKKQKLFTKLHQEGKLKFIEPSDAIKQAYFKKSESSLISAKILLENNRLEESIAMTYYSMYYVAIGLFFRTGIKCKNHSVAIILVKRIFGLDNSQLSFAKKERLDKQYYVDFHVVKKDVKDLIIMAEQFNAGIIDFTARLTNELIAKYRNKLHRLLK